MKTIYTLLFFVLVLGLVACQAEDDTSMKNTGYLSMDITTNNSTATKAGSEEVVYNPKQLAVQILNDQGGVVKETDDYTSWGKPLQMASMVKLPSLISPIMWDQLR